MSLNGLKPTRIVSFGSPKGGAGRTMVVANLTVVYAKGASWAGLTPCSTLGIDLDLQAPGLHYFDFGSQLPGWAIFVGPTPVEPGEEAWDAVRKLVAERRLGMLRWLEAVFADDHFRTILASPQEDDKFSEDVTSFLAKCAEPDDPRNPLNHVIRLASPAGPMVLILPATDPTQDGYQTALLGFDALEFFHQQRGYIVLDSLYAHLLKSAPAEFPRRILLDQGGGSSVAAAVNRAYGDHHVIVSGLNEQHRAGLQGLADPHGEQSFASLSIVLSQYGARRSANGPLGKREEFLEKDESRHKLEETLQGGGVRREQMHTIDFEEAAVGREHFFTEGSEASDELVTLAATIEQDGRNIIVREPPRLREIRVLGEYVSLNGDSPASGALGAFSQWARKEMASTDCDVRTFAASHEQIVELARRSQQAPRRPVNLPPPQPDGVPTRLSKSDVDGLHLSDFDIVALPTYAAREHATKFERLQGFVDGHDPLSSFDHVGPISNEYIRKTIHGWASYAYTGDGTHLVGYPLFTDHQLLVVNMKNLQSRFHTEFVENELREFRGFKDPADLVAAARAADRTTTSRDAFLLVGKSTALGRWYEWRTLVTMFASLIGNQGANDSTEELTEAEAFGTLQYLKMCRLSAPESKESDWDHGHQEFFSEQAVGMLLIWPDAIPAEARVGEREFEYLPLPGPERFEECWLLAVPRQRGASRPDVHAVEGLLRRFLLPDSQQRYLEFGGLPVHRRTARALDNWRKYAFLPPLAWWNDERTSRRIDGTDGRTAVHRAADESRLSMRVALDALQALDAIPPEHLTTADIKAEFSRIRTGHRHQGLSQPLTGAI